MRKFFKDFKAFMSKGNILDMAIGVIIGTAFNKIVSSLVADMLMPVISLVFPGDISNLFSVIKGTPQYNIDGIITNMDAVVILYWGRFFQSIIDFLIIGLTLFVILKVAMSFQKRAEKEKERIKEKLSKGEELTEEEVKQVEEPKPVVSEEVLLLREIRDSLATKSD